jgi:inner membrane protein YidH
METALDSREYLAEERTLLAWLRTSLGIAGLGLVLDRFSIFLQVMQVSARAPIGHVPHVHGLWLVLLSVAVNVLAISRHLATVRAMRRAGLGSAAPQTPVLLLAVLLTLLTAALALSIFPSATAAAG